MTQYYTLTSSTVDHNGNPEHNSKAFEVTDLATWFEVMRNFADFLSVNYGYDISDRIVVKIGRDGSLQALVEAAEEYPLATPPYPVTECF